MPLILRNLGHYLNITICMVSGWPMFSENTLMLYQQDLQPSPSCEMETGNDRLSVAQITHSSFCKIIIMCQIPRVV